MSEKVDR
jgi:hypothetical protein